VNYDQLPADLPRPIDDGACDHLIGAKIPSIRLPATDGRLLALDELASARAVLYCYPMTGVPGVPLPEGWDLIPGARGCTPQACSFRDHHAELRKLGADVLGLSTQESDYQKEMADRLHLPFPILSDARFELCDALRLPTFDVEGKRLVKRITMIIADQRIEHAFYPVFPPDQSADDVLRWLSQHPGPGIER
jgi:peroxiredoxin